MDLASLYQKYLSAGQQVSTDSRKIQRACLFFALKGPHFDGNKYAADALAKGAAWAIVDDPSVQEGSQFILVDDVLGALQDLANHHRKQFQIPIIGITGSNGKTTTKELLASVFKTHYATHFTQGNFNNHIGVPLTLLAMPMDTEIAIIEMGANHQGEITQLCEIAEPSHGIITNIGKAHLEGFGGIEGVKKGKSELYRFLVKHRGIAFVNRDESFLSDLSEDILKRIFYFQSQNPTVDEPGYETALLQESPFLKVGFIDKAGVMVEADTHLRGMHNFENLKTTTCLGKYFKVPHGKIKYALERYIPSNNRSQNVEWGQHQVLLDAYNANPSSMEVTLNAFAETFFDGKKVVIIGDMLELGEASEQEHLKIAQLVNGKSDFDLVLLIGPLFKQAASTLGIKHFLNVNELKAWWQENEMEPSFILLKASRGIQLEKFLVTDKE